MRMIRFFILPLLVVSACVFLLFKSIDLIELSNKRDIEQRSMEFAMRLIPKVEKNKGIDDKDRIVLKQILVGFSSTQNIPLIVDSQKNGNIVIKSPAANEEETLKILQQYENLMQFVTSVKSLPYTMVLEDFCLGKGCPGGFIMSLKFSR